MLQIDNEMVETEPLGDSGSSLPTRLLEWNQEYSLPAQGAHNLTVSTTVYAATQISIMFEVLGVCDCKPRSGPTLTEFAESSCRISKYVYHTEEPIPTEMIFNLFLCLYLG